MRLLLFALGLLALASGGLKFRERIMNKIGASPLALGEIGLGLAACATALLVSDGVRFQGLVAGLTLIAVLAGSYHQSKLTAEFRRRRELSESHRLRQFVEGERDARAPSNRQARRVPPGGQAAPPTPRGTQPPLTRPTQTKPSVTDVKPEGEDHGA